MSLRSKIRRTKKRRAATVTRTNKPEPVVCADPAHYAFWRDRLKVFDHSPPMPPSVWQETYRRLPRGASARTGAWKNFPYQVAMFDAIANPNCSSLTMMLASQVLGKTSIVEGIIAWQVDQAPCATIAVFPTHANAVAWSKNRLGPMIEHTPRLSRLID